MHPATIFTVLADLAPAGRERVFDATGGRALLWLADPDRAPRTRTAGRLAATDALHHDERVLRRGWLRQRTLARAGRAAAGRVRQPMV